MEINNDADVALADALVQLDRDKTRENLAAVLDLTNPGWRTDEVIVGWVKDRGIEEAAVSLLKRHLT